ncbi:MAG: hypothetical protein IKP12_07395 [Acholeplasmatales bacterium]|nr:hypothetical protein [Acholeplasmatales bacterium]
MPQIETLENAKISELQTHYFKASYDQIKEVYLKTLNRLGHEVISVNDDFGEIFSEIPHFSVNAKIIMQNPKETSIDFYIDSEFLLGNTKKAIKFMEEVYKDIEKVYELKGVSLHR